MKKEYELIGGWSHGEIVAVDESESRLESPVFEDENHLKEPFRSEAYTKRRFAGEEFGDGFDCYGFVDDDDTDTRELARMELQLPVIAGSRSVVGTRGTPKTVSFVTSTDGRN